MKILVIRFNAVGDVVLTSALCTTLKKSFPDAQIDYLMNESISPLFSTNPIINRVLFFSKAERKNPFKLLKKMIKITRQKYDVIVDVSSTGRSELVSLFSRDTKFRIGRFKQGRGFFYTHNIIRESLTEDKITERLAMLKPLTQSGFDIQYTNEMSIHITDDELCIRKNEMLNAGIDFNRPVFAFNVSSKKTYKVWNLKYMSEVIQYCVEHYQAQVILCAGLEHEKQDAKKVHKMLDGPSDVFLNIHIGSLRELAATIKHCDVYVGNEGGPRHIAHALGLPTVSIFSPSSSCCLWVPEAGPRHKAIQWEDIDSNKEVMPNTKEGDSKYYMERGDSQYCRLYNTIKPEHFTPLLDEVLMNENIQKR